MRYVYSENRTIINWLKLRFAETFLKNSKKSKEVVSFQSIEDFFTEIKESVKELDLTENSVDFYIKAIESARENGQKALMEILHDKKNVLLIEFSLAKHRKNLKYVEEADVVKYYKKTNKADRYLHHTWMKNYTRVIPEEVITMKKGFDELYIFDNYVIMHFDKHGDAQEMTKKEKEKAKDPILFGVIKGSTKLYFIGDWIDEYCDHTLDKFLKTLEQKTAKKLTQKSVKESV